MRLRRTGREKGSVRAKVELEVGVVAQDRWARTTGARTLCTLWKRGTVSPATRNTLEQAKRPRAAAQGAREQARERVLQQHSRASTWPEAQPNALLASGACHPA